MNVTVFSTYFKELQEESILEWTADMVENNLMEIEIIFEKPYAISALSKPDMVQIDFFHPHIFRSIISNKTISNQYLRKIIPV